MKNIKITHKIYIILGISIIISVLISSISATSYLFHQTAKETFEKDQIHLKGLVNNIEGFMAHAFTLNSQLSLNQEIIESIKSADINWENRIVHYNDLYDTQTELDNNSGLAILKNLQANYNFVELFFVQDQFGDQTGRSFGSLGHRAERWWFKKITQNKNYHPFISNSYYSLTGDIPVASVFHPIFDQGEFIGVMGTDINFNFLQNTVNNFLQSNELYAVVIDSEGVIIAHPDKSIIREIYNLKKLTHRVLIKSDTTKTFLNSTGTEHHQIEEQKLDWNPEISAIASKVTNGESGVQTDITFGGLKSTIHYAPVTLPASLSKGSNYGVMLIHDGSSISQTKINIFIFVCLLTVVLITILILVFRSSLRQTIIIPLEALIESMNNADFQEVKEIPLQSNDEFGILARTYNQMRRKLAIANNRIVNQYDQLLESETGYKAFAKIGLALSLERNTDKLLELILDEAMRLSNSDGGTLYIYDEENKQLDFKILHNTTLKISMGGTSDTPVNLPGVPLMINGEPNHNNVSSHAAISGSIVNIPDAKNTKNFDFSGTRKYDAVMGYNSKSMLVLPMKNAENDLIGVIQLINTTDAKTGQIISFSQIHENLIASLASQAAVVLTNVQLSRELENLFNAFITSIATAIDEKSPYTGGHITRVVKLTMAIAEKINNSTKDTYKDTLFSENQLEELRLAAWMHDIGKITTPEHIADKATKLQGIIDGIELVESRFQLIQTGLENAYLKNKIKLVEDKAFNPPELEKLTLEFNRSIEQIQKDIKFLKSCNQSGEYLSDASVNRIQEISTQSFKSENKSHPYLTEKEALNLGIRKGTLNDFERKQIENHAKMTMKILEQLPFQKHIANVAKYAAMHHERPDGSGYYQGCQAEEIPLQARIIALSDIFEALTAKDRPYREPMKFSHAIKTLDFMMRDNHIDPDLYKFVLSEGIFKEYAKTELYPDQCDIL